MTIPQPSTHRSRAFDPQKLNLFAASRHRPLGEEEYDVAQMERANSLRDCCVKVVGDFNRLSMVGRHVDGESAQAIVDSLPVHERLDRSTIIRRTPNVIRSIRRHGLVGQMLPWIEQCDGGILSMRNCQPLRLDRDAFMVTCQHHREVVQHRPNDDDLLDFLSTNSTEALLDLANDHESETEPYLACWQDSGVWYMDTPVVMDNESSARDAAHRSKVYHIATGDRITP